MNTRPFGFLVVLALAGAWIVANLLAILLA